MALRFWRRFKLLPGVTLNLSKSGGSLSFGPRGAKFTVGPRGTRKTVGVPGTGLFYTEHAGGSGTRRGRSRRDRDAPAVAPSDRLTLGFFRRLVTPQDEEDLVDGLRELVAGRETAALARLRKATSLPDGAFLAGMLALGHGSHAEAERWLSAALEHAERLGTTVGKYGVAATISLPVTEFVTAHVGPGRRGTLLALAELCQDRGDLTAARRHLERLLELDPGDVVVRVSLAEILLEAAEARGDAGREACEAVVHLAKGVRNRSTVHAAMLHAKGLALARLGLATAARDAFTAALRRRKDRPESLLTAVRYERARVYETLGRASRARAEFEKVYAADPGFADVAARLGV